VTSTVNNAPATYSGTTSYGYDLTASSGTRRSQLTQETSSRGGGYTNTFGYDGGTSSGPGNPTSFKGMAIGFNSDNQIMNSGYGYDGAGNPSTYKSRTLTFDPENRMTAYGSLQTDGYDLDNLRAWKQTSGVSRTYFLYDSDRPVCEYDNTGTLTASNTFGVDGLVSRCPVNSGITTFYTFDERGNVSQRLSNSGTVQSTDLYDSYGSRTGTTSQPDPWGYEAQEGYTTDTETGMLLLTHRFYDPSNGRFLTRDPMGYSGGINLYGYVKNNPINFTDPTGYWIGTALCDLCDVVSVIEFIWAAVDVLICLRGGIIAYCFYSLVHLLIGVIVMDIVCKKFICPICIKKFGP